jgi:CheY-like chemotaxis protein
LEFAVADVLVIDDDPLARLILRSALESAGHQVSEAAGGAEALRLFRVAPAELVFCDMYMPDGDGLETIPALRREWPRVRIVAVSGGSRTISFDALPVAASLGAVLTLRKPLGREDVLAAAEQALRDAGPEW